MASCQHIILRGKRTGEACGYPGVAKFSLCHGCLSKAKKYNYIHDTCLHLKIQDADVNITIVMDVYDHVEDISTILKEEEATFVIISKEKVYDLLGILDPDGSLRKPTSEEKEIINALHI